LERFGLLCGGFFSRCGLFSTHPPTEERVARLSELATGMRLAA
jgi:Zn-dependent protease with chaperone function